MRVNKGKRLVSFAVLASLAGALSAQSARVVTANASNGRILDLTFEPPGSTVLNTDANLRVGIESVVFRDDGAAGLHLLVADRQAGKVIFYVGGAGAGATVLGPTTPAYPPFPDGLSLDARDDLFGVTSAEGAGADKDARVWVLRRDSACSGSCLPGGYAPRVGTLDGTVEASVTIGGVPTTLLADILSETRVVLASAGTLEAGDLLVLSSTPAMLLRYPAASVEAFLAALALGGTPAELVPEVFISPSGTDAPAARSFPPLAEPQGMDLTPAGDLLVSSGGGTILIYGADGMRRSNGAGGFLDFAQGLGQGKFKLAVGPQDGLFRAFVADRNGGEVLRFGIQPDGTGLLDGLVADPEFPVGITTTTASVVPTPAGQGVTIRPTNLMQTTIENVVLAGSTSVSVLLFEDPRESEVSVAPDQPLHRSLSLGEIRADLPADIEIPAFVRAFPTLAGAPTFLLLVADTSADAFGLVAHVVDEGLVLGYEPDCEDPDPTAQPRLFWVPSPDETPILEGPVFIDVSNDCGTSRGLTRGWSLFLAGARDTRPTREIAATKLSALSSVLDGTQCMDRRLSRSLRKKLDSALRQLERRKYAAAIDALTGFSLLVQQNPGAFSSCGSNEAGELRARADSAVFILGKLP